MTNILVLAGGSSPERDVSLRSGAAVSAALEQAGHTVASFDPIQPLTDSAVHTADVVFPVLHGVGGEDGFIQQQLEAAGAAYVGSNSVASALCFDKSEYRSFLTSHAIRVPVGKKVDFTGFITSSLIKKPYVLKPFDGGSSLDTFIVRSPSVEQNERVAEVFNRHQQMLLEELIVGTEITVGVFNNQALPVIEIIPPADGEFDYENKYNGRTQELCPPQNLSDENQLLAQSLAAKIHRLCNCRDFSRTDMIVAKNDTIYVLETNTIPGMTDQSLLPKAAATAGITMQRLCDQLVQAALNR